LETGIGSLIIRKLITTFFTTTIFSILLFFFIIDSSKIVHDREVESFGWFFIFFIYGGIIILLYGNLVSIGTEYLQRKWFKEQDWLYVVILGIFGLANGLLFQEISFSIYGLLAALLYAIVDKCLFKRFKEDKSVKAFFLIPIALLLLCWGYIQLSSPPIPPFTKEDAVQFVTSGEGTAIEYFPNDIGKWEGTVDGYRVKRETNAKEIEKEVYLVTFTETWGKGTRDRSWVLSYKVNRGSSSAYGEKGIMPPYYEGN